MFPDSNRKNASPRHVSPRSGALLRVEYLSGSRCLDSLRPGQSAFINDDTVEPKAAFAEWLPLPKGKRHSN